VCGEGVVFFMASQDKLRAMFNEMNTEQKGNFIINLEKSLAGSDDTDSLLFLSECKAQHNMELKAKTTVIPMTLEDDVALDSASEIADSDLEQELELELESELEIEAEVGVESELEPELAVGVELELEPEPEPELEAEVGVEAELELDPELGAELESELELGLDSESGLELDPELDSELESGYDAGLTDELDLLVADAGGLPEHVSESATVSAIGKSKVDSIEMEISKLADNIRYKMSVIDTISFLLSGKGSEFVEEIAMANESDPELSPENALAYDSKVEHIEVSLSEFAESIRNDIRVMEAISKLLTGSAG